MSESERLDRLEGEVVALRRTVEFQAEMLDVLEDLLDEGVQSRSAALDRVASLESALDGMEASEEVWRAGVGGTLNFMASRLPRPRHGPDFNLLADLEAFDWHGLLMSYPGEVTPEGD